jgi:RNA polymerase sigma-70 factor (ECF subfamily)
MIDVAELYRAEARGLHRFVLFLSGDPALADDLVSETFIRLWTARDRVDLTTVRGYLFAIARNLFLQQRRRRPAAALDEAMADRLADPEAGPHGRAVAREELRATLAALQTLPELDRAALLMRADDGLAYEEIAAALGLAAGAVRVKVHRARLRLAAARGGTTPREVTAGSHLEEQP